MRSIHDDHHDHRGHEDHRDPGQERGRRRGGPRERRGGPGRSRRRASRGDVRTAVLQLLAEEPMHGYQLMQAIAERTGGRWSPSPGAIYPTINQLEDEGLVVLEASSGRKLVSLTDAGRAQVEADREAGREPFESYQSMPPEADLRALLYELHGAVRQVARNGSSTQRQEAARLIADARRSIYLLLADGATTTGETDAGGDDRLVARASVATATPARYLKQLAAHLGRRSEVHEEADGTRILLTNGECLLTATEDTLEMVATADTDEALEAVTHVAGSHLERFGQRNELVVTWVRD